MGHPGLSDKEAERVMLRMRSAGYLESRESSSYVAGVCRMLYFPGRRTGNPLSYASVAITLDNSDHKLPVEYGEVTVQESCIVLVKVNIWLTVRRAD